ncbi:AMP-binding protein [Demequina phytophila]|uniref:AMP-binding protein n=1 Tax=Demequina phytophila TaxID=1638981 RepID=UPI000780DCA4|nr:AMP-binding protein [Demequina phytophila]
MTYARLADDPFAAVDDALAGRADGVAAATSGSTGAPREVLVPASAIRASAELTAARLGGEAAWLLAIPATRIGGAMVVARARLAGTPLATLPAGPFTASAFADATAALPPGRRHVSLVPTQVRRLLADAEGRDALATYDAVLVGGAALPERGAPANLVRTYGMSETSGGCVYDGVPLDGVGVRIDGDGRILLSGPTLAAGYADGDGSAFIEIDGVRWFRTSDVGERRADGRLAVLGRADHVINTGGVKVHPQRIELALERAGATAVAVVGIPDAEWGEAVVAVVEGRVDDAAVAAALEGLAPYERPKRIVHAPVPRTAGGKIDRPATRALASEEDR